MKFSIPVLMCLITELVSADARSLTASLSRRDGVELRDDLLSSISARQTLEDDEMTGPLARSVHVKRVNRAVTQQGRNRQQQAKNTNQQRKNNRQQVANQRQSDGNQAQAMHNSNQGKSNFAQQKKNERQQNANTVQGVDNLEQKHHNTQQQESNSRQDRANQGQQHSNAAQDAGNTVQRVNNDRQERLNTNQQEANLRQEDSNTAQKTSNTQQERDNQATRHAIAKSKPSTLDKCLDFASGACTVAAGAVTLTGLQRMQHNPDDPTAYPLAMAGGAATVAAGALTLAKEPLKKCIGAACHLAKAAYNRVTGANNQNHAAVPPPTEVIAVRALARRGLVRDMLVGRGLPQAEVVKHVEMDTKHFIARNIVRKSVFLGMQADMLDDIIWG